MKKTLKFTKMQGLGNDFVIVDYEEIKKYGLDYIELSKQICDRHFGIGADGLIVVNPEDLKGNTDTSWRIFNSDGSEPQMCGNGIRCFAKYVYDKGLVNKKKFSVTTLAGTIIPEICDDGQVLVNMGPPILEPAKIPVNIESKEPVLNYKIQAKEKEFAINPVSMGNPHCIIFSDEDTENLAKTYGSLIENHELFPEKTNVEFVKVLSKEHIKIDVWERGCGITMACGTGACASSVAAMLNGFVNNTLKAELPGGILEISWESENKTSNVFMKGSAEYVFYGEYLLTI